MSNLLALNDINTNLLYPTLHTQQLQNNISITATNNNDYLLKMCCLVSCSSFSPQDISHKRYTEKLLCFKGTQNSSSLMNVYATSWFHFTFNI